LFNTGTSAITPRLELLRDGTVTPYTTAQVWGEFLAKTTAGSTQSTDYDDAQELSDFLSGATAANQAAGAGTGSWTGASGTAWSGKVDSGAPITPAELGYLSARVNVAIPSTTLYVDPQIRT